MDKTFLKAKDISKILGVSDSMSYKIISQLNSELAEMGYLIVRGKVNHSYEALGLFVSDVVFEDDGFRYIKTKKSMNCRQVLGDNAKITRIHFEIFVGFDAFQIACPAAAIVFVNLVRKVFERCTCGIIKHPFIWVVIHAVIVEITMLVFAVIAK